MLNYIKAEFYRIFWKKGMYIYFGSLIMLMLLGVYLGASNITLSGIKNVTIVSFTLFGTAASAYLLSVVYGDDFAAKTLANVVGFGVDRWVIVVTKFLLNVIMSMLSFFITASIFCLMLMLIGLQLDVERVKDIFGVVTIVVLRGIAISTIASVIAYAFQRGAIAIVVFIMISVGFFTQIIAFVLDKLNLSDLSKYSIDAILRQITTTINVETVLPYVVYVTVFTILAMIVFQQKDLDF